MEQNTNTTNTNEVANVENTQAQAAVQNEQPAQPEKKKFDLKAFGKKALFAVGGAALVAASFVGGVEVGKHSKGSDSSQTASASSDATEE